MVADPAETGFDLPAGVFRSLEWAATGDTGPTALLLHGLSGVADVWCDTVAALGESRPRCVAVDQRGHGHSPATPGRFRVADHVGDVRALVDRLGAPVHLVGHSMGARVAFVTAARHPELVASVVVVDIGPEACVVEGGVRWLQCAVRTLRGGVGMVERVRVEVPLADGALEEAVERGRRGIAGRFA